jgi:hypothetical protein
MDDYEWYQCDIVTQSGKVIRGIRGIAKSYDLFKKRVETHVLEILTSKKLPVDTVIKEINVKLVEESIKKKYNLNNSEDHDRFIQYLDDDLTSH